MRRPCALPFILLLGPQAICAEVLSLKVIQRVEILAGLVFAGAGPYEKISGRITFAFDPASPANCRIVDLDKAPPESLHPRLDDGTLVPLHKLRWPMLAELAFPKSGAWSLSG